MRLPSIILLMLLFGCVAQQQPNSLYHFAKNAPADASTVAFLNVNRVSSSPALMQLLGLPDFTRYVGGILTILAPNVGIVDEGERGMAFGLEVFLIDFSSRLVQVLGWLDNSLLGGSILDYKEMDVRGTRVESVKNVSYVVRDGRLYLATDQSELYRLVDVWAGSPNAQGRHAVILRRLPEGHVMLVRSDENATMKALAVSLNLRENNMTDIFMAAEANSTRDAELIVMLMTNASAFANMTVHDVHSEDRYVFLNATLNLSQLGSLLPSEEGLGGDERIPEFSVTPPEYRITPDN